MRHALAVGLAVAVALAGCAGAGSAPAHRYHVLEVAAATAVPAAAATRKIALVVMPATTTAFYDTQEIVYSRSAATRAYYQFNSWVEPPGRLLAPLLAERLRRSGAFSGVASGSGAARGELLVELHVDELYHDAATSPGRVVVAVAATLSRGGTRVLVAQKRFVATAPAASYDADGAVAAFDVAVASLLDDIAAWAVASTSP